MLDEMPLGAPDAHDTCEVDGVGRSGLETDGGHDGFLEIWKFEARNAAAWAEKYAIVWRNVRRQRRWHTLAFAARMRVT